jgi:hypothetical protein
MYEAIKVRYRDGELTLIKNAQCRAAVFSYEPMSEWGTGTPAILIPAEGEGFIKAQVVRNDAGLTFEPWTTDDWPLSEELADHKDILLVALTCFPSDKDLALDLDAMQAP